DAQGPDYLVSGLRYRGEGDCREAVKSYQMAQKLAQFKEDWLYHLAVADCFVALKQLDDAIDSYTKVLEATSNRTLQGDMYRGRAFAYYLKAVSPDAIDPKILALARKDLDSAMDLGADVSDLRKNMKDDIDTKRAKSDIEQGTIVTGQPVTIIESQDRMVVGDGEYLLYITGDTKITDRKGMAVPASDIKPGDLIDFSYTASYRNKADGMVHLSAKTITMQREVAVKPASAETKEKPAAPDAAEMLILSKINMLADEVKELREKLLAPAKQAAKPKAKKKSRKKSLPGKKAQPVINELQGEIK
ncbi:MAG: hypothetical protein HQL08_11755, partial [Nitrospirae bacterium]|nr:hypothetical protein [Nitrospirota bacterium]